MTKDQFTKLFSYMTQRFDAVDERFENQAARFDQIDQRIDYLIKRQEVNEDERLLLGRLIDQHDTWLNQIANKINHKLSP